MSHYPDNNNDPASHQNTETETLNDSNANVVNSDDVKSNEGHINEVASDKIAFNAKNDTTAENQVDFVYEAPDKNNEKASLISVFRRSAGYEGRFLLYHPWDYLMLLWLPLFTILCMWWIFSKPYIVDVSIGVIDQSNSSYSRTLTRYLEASPDLHISHFYPSRAAAHEAILDNKIYGVVIIPSNFADNINQGKTAPVVLKVNAQYGTHSGIVQRGVQSVVGTLSAGVEIQRSVKQGSQLDQAKVTYAPIGVERISLFNIGTNYQQFLGSTIIPALLHILIMIIGATTIGRELRDKTFAEWYRNMTMPSLPYPDFGVLKNIPPEQKLAAMYAQNNHIQLPTDSVDEAVKIINETLDERLIQPQQPTQTPNLTKQTREIVPNIPDKISIPALVVGLNGKLVWALLFYMLWGALMLTLVNWVHPSSASALFVVFIAYIALTMISLWLGAIVSLTSYSLRMGLSSTAFISAPSFAFAGVTFPLLSMSEGAQRWSNALPLTHYLKIHLSQLQMLAPRSVAYSTLFGLIIAVIVMLVITALLCVRAFKHPERWGAR